MCCFGTIDILNISSIVEIKLVAQKHESASGVGVASEEFAEDAYMESTLAELTKVEQEASKLYD